jgi:myo-inositol-1(or 4)-monophosphatase
MGTAETEPSAAAELERAACEACHAAGKVLRRRFRGNSSVRVRAKGWHDYVTDVDDEAEDAIVRYLSGRFPDHAVMSEEGSPDAPAAAHRWIVDPLDGTANFIHGVTPFSVAVALEDEQGLLAAAVHDPYHDETFHARRGAGARLDGEPIRCSEPDGLEQALLATGFPFRELTRVKRYLDSFEAFIRTTAGIRRAGSAAIDLAYTACGRYDGFWEVGLSRWDVAAGVLLVREAGGRVTDVVGGDSTLDTGDIVAAGARLHPMLLAVTREAFGEGR